MCIRDSGSPRASYGARRRRRATASTSIYGTTTWRRRRDPDGQPARPAARRRGHARVPRALGGAGVRNGGPPPPGRALHVDRVGRGAVRAAVSYTHLTLPTSDL